MLEVDSLYKTVCSILNQQFRSITALYFAKICLQAAGNLNSYTHDVLVVAPILKVKLILN
jgi:hypothetical protein